MFEESDEVEDSDEEPMEQDGQDGAGDPDDGDDSDSSDSEGEDGDGGGDDGGDSGNGGDDENGGGDGDDYHAVVLAKEWTIEIHFDLHGDAYYHIKLLSLVRCYHTSVLCSTTWSIGPTLTTLASGRRRCTSTKGVGCATSSMVLQPNLHVQLPSKMLLGRRWWSIVTVTSVTSHGKKIAIFLIVRAARPPATSPHHFWRKSSGLGLLWCAWPKPTPTWIRF